MRRASMHFSMPIAPLTLAAGQTYVMSLFLLGQTSLPVGDATDQASYNIGGAFASSVASGGSDEDREIVGPVAHWVDVLTRLAIDVGFSSFVLWGEPEPGRLRTFIEEVAPAVRERVGVVRSGRA